MSKKEEEQQDVINETTDSVEETQDELIDDAQGVTDNKAQERKETLERVINGFFEEPTEEPALENDTTLEEVTETDHPQETVEPPKMSKPTKKKFPLFKTISLTLIVSLIVSVVILAIQLNQREKVIQDTQEDLVSTYEELTKLQNDSKDMSNLVLEQQEKIKQYDVDIEKYQTVVDARDGEIAKLQTLVTENEEKVLELQKQLEELDLKFTTLKDDIMLFVEE